MSAIDVSTTLVRSSGPLVADVDDEVVMLDPSTSRYFGLDGTGARIWALIEQPRTVGSVVSELLTEFEIDEATCLQEVLAFAGDLEQAGLVEVRRTG